MNEAQQEIKVKHLVPTVTSDGHIVMINDQGVPVVLFFQAREQHEGHLHGDVVASVKLNNLDDLEKLAEAISDTIKKHKTRER